MRYCNTLRRIREYSSTRSFHGSELWSNPVSFYYILLLRNPAYCLYGADIIRNFSPLFLDQYQPDAGAQIYPLNW